MLFGYMNVPHTDQEDDVLSTETSLECFAFDRPLLLPSELHVAGAMAFATTFGFAGMSLIEWALLQTLESARTHTDFEEVSESFYPPSIGND